VRSSRCSRKATVRSHTPHHLSLSLLFLLSILSSPIASSICCHQIALPSHGPHRRHLPASRAEPRQPRNRNHPCPLQTVQQHQGSAYRSKERLGAFGTRSDIISWNFSSLFPRILRVLATASSAIRPYRPTSPSTSLNLVANSKRLRAPALTLSRCSSECSSPFGAFWRSLHW